MQVRVIEPFKVRGELMTPGTVLNIADEALTRLAGRVVPVEPATADHLIQWKTKTGRILYLITSERIRRSAPGGKAVFSRGELEKMRGLPDEQIKAIVDVKEVFQGAEVEA